MSIRLKSILRVGLSILFALVFLYLAFKGSDFEKLKSSLGSANYFLVLLLIPCLFVSNIFRALRWRYLLNPIKKNISFRNLFSSLMIGYMVNNALPRVGEIVRPYNLGRLENISKSAVLGTVLVERILDLFSFLLCLAVIFYFYQDALVQAFPWLTGASIILSVMTVGAFGVFTFLLGRRELAFRWVRKVARLFPSALGRKAENLLHSFLDGFLIIKEPRQYLMIGVQTVVIWLWYALMMYVPFFAFRMVENYSLNFGSAIVIMVISAIGFIIPVPGATGTYHWVTRECLVRLFGVDVEVALSYATVTHLLGFVAVTVVGLLYFLRDHLRFSEAIRARDETEVEELVPETTHDTIKNL
ncbi:MAG: lysylphosphatidylglycerol synthase transmembrane domain-containing protein [Bacteroidota bacterium]